MTARRAIAVLSLSLAGRAAAGVPECGELPDAFWNGDAPHATAAFSSACAPVAGGEPAEVDAVLGANTALAASELSRFECRMTGLRGVGCSTRAWWSANLRCGCTVGGKRRDVGLTVSCTVERGQVACRSRCTRAGCDGGRVLGPVSPQDVPQVGHVAGPLPIRIAPDGPVEPDARKNVGACFRIGRPADLAQDGGADTEGSFTRCLARGLERFPSPGVCNLLGRTLDGDPQLADRCHQNLAWAAGDAVYCDRIVASASRDECLEHMAIATGRRDLCDRTRRRDRAYTVCLASVAQGAFKGPQTMMAIRATPIRGAIPSRLGSGELPGGTLVEVRGHAADEEWPDAADWYYVTLGHDGFYVEKRDLVPFPIPTEPAWVVVQGARVQVDAPGAARTRALELGKEIEISRAGAVRLPGRAAVVEKGEIAGWVEESAVRRGWLALPQERVFAAGGANRRVAPAPDAKGEPLPAGAPIHTVSPAELGGLGFAAVVEAGRIAGFVETSRLSRTPPSAGAVLAGALDEAWAGRPEAARSTIDAGLARAPGSPDLVALRSALDDWRAPVGAPVRGEIAPPSLPPSRPVTGAGDGWVVATSATVRDTASADAKIEAFLPAGALVHVLRVEGAFARIETREAARGRVALDLGRAEAPRAPVPPLTRGFVSVAALDLERPTADAALAKAGASREAGRTDEEIAWLARAHALAPGDPGVLRRWFDAAVAARRWPEAIQAARTAAALAPEGGLLRIRVDLVRGCRGSPGRAELHAVEPFGKVPAGRDACVRWIAPGPCPPCGDPFTEYEPSDDVPDTEGEEREAKAAVAEKHEREHVEPIAREVSRYEAWLKRVDAVFAGPHRLRIRLENPTRWVLAPRERFFLYEYGYEQEAGCYALGDAVRREPGVAVRLLPSLALEGGGQVDLWLDVGPIAPEGGRAFGVVTAADEAQARRAAEARPMAAASVRAYGEVATVKASPDPKPATPSEAWAPAIVCLCCAQ